MDVVQNASFDMKKLCRNHSFPGKIKRPLEMEWCKFFFFLYFFHKCDRIFG